TAEPLPVVLFEPPRALMMHNPQTGLVQEAKVEGVIASGFHRVPIDPVWALAPAPGWEVRRVPDGLVLRDGTGDVWASSQVTLDPAWVSAATSSRQVGVFYGPQLGVRVPPGTKTAAYTTAKRAAPLRKARDQGLVTPATVTWHGEPAAETLEWVIFQPGSFGQPFAGVFAPIASFTRHGGPEMFGLAQLRDQDMGISADPIRTLAARVSRTDIDLIDPAEDAIDGQVGGVHYAEGIHRAWRRGAPREGKAGLPPPPARPAGRRPSAAGRGPRRTLGGPHPGTRRVADAEPGLIHGALSGPAGSSSRSTPKSAHSRAGTSVISSSAAAPVTATVPCSQYGGSAGSVPLRAAAADCPKA